MPPLRRQRRQCVLLAAILACSAFVTLFLLSSLDAPLESVGSSSLTAGRSSASLALESALSSEFRLDPRLGLYRWRGLPVLWVYWSGPMPDLVRLSLATLHCNCARGMRLLLVNDSTAAALFGRELHPAFSALSPNHRADYFRFKVLEKFGGVYLDADSVGLSSFAQWLEALENADVVGVASEWESESISVCSIGPVRANNRLLHACSTRVDRSLDAYWRGVWRPLHVLTGLYPFRWTHFSRMLSETLDSMLATSKASEAVSATSEPLAEASGPVRYVARSAIGEHGQLIALEQQLGARAKHIEQRARPHLRFTFHETEVLFYHASEARDLQREPLQRLLASDSLLVELHRFALWKCRQPADPNPNPNPNVQSARGSDADWAHARTPAFSLLEQPRAGVFAVGGDDWRAHRWNAPEHLEWIARYVQRLHAAHYSLD